MPQLSLYLDDDLMDKLRDGASRAHLSLSKYAARCIDSETASALWPQGFWDLYGSVDDGSFRVPDELGFELDGPRLPL